MPERHVCPVAHCELVAHGPHALATQAWPCGHVFPHPPQLAGSAAVGRHPPSQAEVPDGHVAPSEGEVSAGALESLASPLASSSASGGVAVSAPVSVAVCTSFAASVGALHALLEHCPPLQLIAHWPQFAGSAVVSTQLPLHIVFGAAQVAPSGRVPASNSGASLTAAVPPQTASTPKKSVIPATTRTD